MNVIYEAFGKFNILYRHFYSGGDQVAEPSFPRYCEEDHTPDMAHIFQKRSQFYYINNYKHFLCRIGYKAFKGINIPEGQENQSLLGQPARLACNRDPEQYVAIKNFGNKMQNCASCSVL